MKILIAYYSKTGGTEKMADAIGKELKARGHSVDVERIIPKKEHSFWNWWNVRMLKSECEIEPPKIKDVSKYDAICVGTPNWTRLSMPVARYLKEIEGLKYKSVGCFSTTTFPPQIEWYFISAYFLDITFSKRIESAGGKIISRIMLSSFFGHWGVFSAYGEKIIKRFCDKINSPPEPVREYAPRQKEIEGNRFIISLILIFGFLFLAFQIISVAIGKYFFPWDSFFIIFTVIIVVYIAVLLLMTRNKEVFWAKYIFISYAVLIWTFLVFFLGLNLSRVIILGYVILLMLSFLFKSARVTIWGGLLVVISYFFLLFEFSKKIDFSPGTDIFIIFIAAAIITYVNYGLNKNFLSLLDIQDEIEEARTTLEIKVLARTRELREIAGGLESKVEERTTDLQKKIEELEKFLDLTVGRELRMVELKEEIKILKEQLKERQKKNG
jgi:hypothetical protein